MCNFKFRAILQLKNNLQTIFGKFLVTRGRAAKTSTVKFLTNVYTGSLLGTLVKPFNLKKA